MRFWSILIVTLAIGMAHADTLRLGIQEGSGSSGDADYGTNKYQPFAALLSTYLKSDVTARGLSPFQQFDANTLKQHQIVLVRPANVAGWAITNHGYVAVAALDTTASRKVLMIGSPTLKEKLKTPNGLKGLRVAMPTQGGETYQVALSMLRLGHHRIEDMVLYPVRQQATIQFALENNLADIGFIKNDTTAFSKLPANIAILQESETLPPWVVLVSKSLGEERMEQIKLVFLSLPNNAEQRPLLQKFRITAIRETDGKPYVDMFKRYGGQ